MTRHSATQRTLEIMTDDVDRRDVRTGGHSRRTAELTAALLAELGRSGREAELIVWAAQAHDIGKIGLAAGLLNKIGRLTPKDRALLRTHAERGAALLECYPEHRPIAAAVRHHHERWDGRGYPYGLRGTAIPFAARVIAVAEGFDAMTQPRSYRAALPLRAALRELENGRGTQWDPQVVDALLRLVASGALPTVTAGSAD